MSKERYTLLEIIYNDVSTSNKRAISLWVGVLLTALSTIWVIYHTRQLNTEINQLILEKQQLELDYLNLRLEERILTDNMRITLIAERMNMQAIKPAQQVLILD